jgi:hypothetical protein
MQMTISTAVGGSSIVCLPISGRVIAYFSGSVYSR